MNGCGMPCAFMALLTRDLTLALRRRSEVVTPLVFLVIAVTLFPLSLGPETVLLERIAPGVIWVATLLAALLSLDHLFHTDREEGFLDQLLLPQQPLTLLVMAKVAAHWLTSGLPSLLLAPLLGLLLHLPVPAIAVLMVTLALGTPVLSLVGAIGVALTVARRRGGGLLALLVLPLYIPVLIFGAGAVDQVGAALPVVPYLSILGALLLLAVTLAPPAAAAALRIAME